MNAARRLEQQAELLKELREVVGIDPPNSAVARKRLEGFIDRPHVPETLFEIVLQGDLADAHLAAFPLSLARNELLRRRLLKAVATLPPERRNAGLTALTPEERSRFVDDDQSVVDESVIQASSLLAASSPEAFSELLVAARIPLDSRVIEQLEVLRKRLKIGSTTLYEPLLKRNPSPEARVEIIRILGRDPSPQSAALLKQEQKHVTSPKERLDLRREQLRQSTAALNPQAPPPGLAFLSTLQEDGSFLLDVVHELDSKRLLRESHEVAASGRVIRQTHTLNGRLQKLGDTLQEGWAQLSLAQARSLLERLPQRWSQAVAPTLERLAGIQPEPAAPLPPSEALSPDDISELLVHPVFANWDPVASVIPILVEHFLLVSGPGPDEDFPASDKQVQSLAQQAIDSVKRRRGGLRRLEQGLRHAALWLSLKGDSRASRVSFEAHRVNSESGSQKLLSALSQRKLWQHLWAQVELPDDYRRKLRQLSRYLVGVGEISWEEVRTLDLTQAALEGLAREAGQQQARSGLPSPDSLNTAAAREFALWGKDGLSGLFIRKRIPSRLQAQTFARWLQAQPEGSPAMFDSALRLREESCRGKCPYLCWDGSDADPERAFLLPDLPHEDRPEEAVQLQIAVQTSKTSGSS